MEGNIKNHVKTITAYLFFLQGDIGLNVAQMIVELIRDNRKIVDRITRQQIDEFINLLRSNKVRMILQYWDCFKMGRKELISHVVLYFRSVSYITGLFKYLHCNPNILTVNINSYNSLFYRITGIWIC